MADTKIPVSLLLANKTVLLTFSPKLLLLLTKILKHSRGECDIYSFNIPTLPLYTGIYDIVVNSPFKDTPSF